MSTAMTMFRNVGAILRKELSVYFTTPIAYVMFMATAGVGGFFFIAFVQRFQQVSSLALQMPQYMDAQRLNVTEWIIAPLVGNTVVVFVFVIPCLCMRLLAEERKQRTIELLLTSPLRPVEIVLGKYLGALAVATVSVGILFLFPLLIDTFAGSAGTGGAGGVEWATVLSAYAGVFLYCCAGTAICLFISSLTENQVVAVIVSIIVMLVLYIVSWVGQSAEASTFVNMKDVAEFLSMPHHLDGFVKGKIELKDIAYFASFALLGLFFTHRMVEAQRWG